MSAQTMQAWIGYAERMAAQGMEPMPYLPWCSARWEASERAKLATAAGMTRYAR